MKPFNWRIYGTWILAIILGLSEGFCANPKVTGHELDAPVQAKIQAAYGRLSLAFEVNQGQADKEDKIPVARQRL